jgi:uncharacterized membrane protein
MDAHHLAAGRRHAQARRQRGSMAVTMLLMMLGLITILGLVEVAFQQAAQRDAQKVADLAALSGAQRLDQCAAGNGDNAAARSNAAQENDFQGSLDIGCGRWDPIANAAINDHFGPAAGSAPNAVKVVADRPVSPIFGFAGPLLDAHAKAVASELPPAATFSITPTLLAVEGNGSLEQLLKAAGLDLSGTSLAGYDGLADVDISTSGLLKQLGIAVPANATVGGFNNLLSTQVGLDDLLDAAVTVAGHRELVGTGASVLGALAKAGIDTPEVTLGSPDGQGGLFARIVGDDGDSAQGALNTQVNVLQLIDTAVGVASAKHALSSTTLVDIPSVVAVTAATGLVEPPSIGIGGKGTKAYSAQVRVFLDIETPPSGFALLGGLINLQIHLPIAIDLVNAQAELTDLCDKTDSENHILAEFQVTSSILKMCAGKITQADAFSTVGSCDQIPPHGASPMLGLSAALLNLVSLNTPIVTKALPGGPDTDTLYAKQSAVNGNSLAIGSTVNNLVTTLTSALLAGTATQGQAPSSSPTISQTAQDLWDGTDPSQSNASRTQQALNEIQAASQGLQGLLGGLSSDVFNLLGNTLTLNMQGILGDVGGLLGNVATGLSNVLNGAGCTVFNDQGSCINIIQNALTGGGSGPSSNAVIALLGFVLQTLQGPLNQLGAGLSNLLQNTLGLDLGRSTLTLHSLQCHRVQLVY